MSTLASVVSDGSPGSTLLMMEDDPFPLWLPLGFPSADGMERVRGRLGGGRPDVSAFWFWFWFWFGGNFLDFPLEEAAAAVAVAVAAADSSPSSPEASREDGWSCSAVEVDSLDVGSRPADAFDELRLRLFAGEVDDVVGEAMVKVKRPRRDQMAQTR